VLTTRPRFWIAPVGLSIALLVAPVAAAPEPPASPAPPKATGPAEVEVKYIDDSSMKLKLIDETIELVTKHGTLKIATTDIRRIEFATRVPTDVAEKVNAAIGKLGHSDFKTRENATEELKGYRERAYAAVVKAKKSSDPEVARRAEEIAKHIQGKVPAALLEQREFDVVHTDDSKITGKLSAESIRVSTFQFGEQKLKLTDMRSIKLPGPAEEVLVGLPAPQNMLTYQNQFGKELAFSVTGAQPGANGSVWGTDVYTLDSHFQSAVVHAGLAKSGETAVVRVRIIQSPPQYNGSTRNGITTTAYGAFPAGAFEFIRR